MSTPAREQFNCRLPAFTKQQIAELSKRLGLSQSEVIILAIDRMARPVEEAVTTPPTSSQAPPHPRP